MPVARVNRRYNKAPHAGFNHHPEKPSEKRLVLLRCPDNQDGRCALYFPVGIRDFRRVPYSSTTDEKAVASALPVVCFQVIQGVAQIFLRVRKGILDGCRSQSFISAFRFWRYPSILFSIFGSCHYAVNKLGGSLQVFLNSARSTTPVRNPVVLSRRTGHRRVDFALSSPSLSSALYRVKCSSLMMGILRYLLDDFRDLVAVNRSLDRPTTQSRIKTEIPVYKPFWNLCSFRYFFRVHKFFPIVDFTLLYNLQYYIINICHGYE